MDVRLDVAEGAITMTFTRSEKRNAINGEMQDLLGQDLLGQDLLGQALSALAERESVGSRS